MQASPAFEWINTFEKYGWKFGLERINYLMERLGNPQRELKTIHVTGTNGKGSVCKFLTSILQNAGYKTGLYLSPHLSRFSERFTIDTKEITEEEIAALVEQLQPVVDDMIQHQTPPTFFEVITAMAFLYFRNNHVDYAVIEVGLGGRFDATNVVTPLVSVITNISLEHTNILGNDLASIAFEKAGIIKQHVPVVTAATKTAREVIELVALEKDASLTIVEKKAWKRLSRSLRHQEFSLRGSLKEYTVRTSLLGLHQGENLAVTIAAIEHLQLNGVYMTDHDIVEGIAKTMHPGRMELVAEDPLILLDGAHNPDAMNHLVQTLKEFSYDRLILVLGILRDKDVDLMLAAIVPRATVVIVTRSMNARACEPVVLKEKIERLQIETTVFLEETVSQAVAHAQRIAKPKDMICISGSLFTVGEARSYLNQHGR